MSLEFIDRAVAHISRTPIWARAGMIVAVRGRSISVEGISECAQLGDYLEVIFQGETHNAEIIKVDEAYVEAFADSDLAGLALGTQVALQAPPHFAPHEGWIGRVIDPNGAPIDGKPLIPGVKAQKLQAAPIAAHARRSLGKRTSTGLAVFDTLLPLARGQRIGLFAGSGVGKSTLLGELARSVQADVIVIGLVGERGRELRDFLDDTLGEEGRKRAVVIAATSDRAPQVRRRCAFAATAVAEYFRDQGKHVLLLMDSVTRFAEAHREVAAAAGEPSNLRGFPASTSSAIAGLCERAGPGAEGAEGDITAIYSVLVAGSDMEEPVADILRGVLDGHIVLDREIAERGRFPAIDILRSVSRSLPRTATEEENALIKQARHQLGTYEKSEMMVQAGLYSAGSDPALDLAIQVAPALDQFAALREPAGPEASFAALKCILRT